MITLIVAISLINAQTIGASQVVLPNLQQLASQQGWGQSNQVAQSLPAFNKLSPIGWLEWDQWIQTWSLESTELDIQSSRLLKLKEDTHRLELNLQWGGQKNQPIYLAVTQNANLELTVELSFYSADQTQQRWVYKEREHDFATFWTNVLSYLKNWQEYEELTQALILAERLQRPNPIKSVAYPWWSGSQAYAAGANCLVAGWPGVWINQKCSPIDKKSAFSGTHLVCNPSVFSTDKKFPRTKVPSDATALCDQSSDVNQFLIKKVTERSSNVKNQALFDEQKASLVKVTTQIHKDSCVTSQPKSSAQQKACKALQERLTALNALNCQAVFSVTTAAAALSPGTSPPTNPAATSSAAHFECVPKLPVATQPATPVTPPPVAAIPAPAAATVPAPTPAAVPVAAVSASATRSAPVARSRVPRRSSSSWSFSGWAKVGLAVGGVLWLFKKLEPKPLSVTTNPTVNPTAPVIGLPIPETRPLPPPTGTR